MYLQKLQILKGGGEEGRGGKNVNKLGKKKRGPRNDKLKKCLGKGEGESERVRESQEAERSK